MSSRWLVRAAAASVAVGVLTLTRPVPASAHDVPADGFNAVLAASDHDLFAADTDVSDCAKVRAGVPDLTMVDKDVWVFGAPQGSRFTEGSDPPAVQLIFLNPDDGLESDLTIPGTGNATSLAGAIAAIAVPAGWQLLDGDAKITTAGGGESTETPRFGVLYTCPAAGTATQAPPKTSNPPAAPGAGGGLPLTGSAIGGIVVLGCGLLAAGVALLAVRRHREIY